MFILHSTTDNPASSNAGDCKCAKGKYQVGLIGGAKKPECVECPEGFYCDGSTNTQGQVKKERCTSGSTTEGTGKTTLDDCKCDRGS